MCGRISTADLTAESLTSLFGLDRVSPFKPSYNVAPSLPIPAVRERMQRETERIRTLDLLSWGLIPHWAKDAGIARHTFNARLETAAQKPSFRDAFRSRRCIVPVSGFYEWQRDGASKHPFYIRRADRSPLALAGLWDRRADGKLDAASESCCIVTMPAAGRMAGIHHRMPAILEPDHFAAWLDPGMNDPDRLRDLLEADRPELDAEQVSSYVNDARHDGAKCVARADRTD